MAGLDIGFAAAAAGGLISFLSPCVLPLVPAYLCFIAGTTLDELLETTEAAGAEARRLNRRVLIGAVGFVLGFTTVFVALGASASAINPLIMAYKVPLAWIAGVVIILFGLHFMGLFRFSFLYREARFMPALPDGMIGAQSFWQFLGPYVLGLAFAFGWTPCIGPILATILAIAATHDSLRYGVALLTVYSLGLGIPFFLSALAMNRFLQFSTRFRRHMRKVEIAAGLLLVGTGFLILTGTFERIAIFLLDNAPWLAEFG